MISSSLMPQTYHESNQTLTSPHSTAPEDFSHGRDATARRLVRRSSADAL